MFSAYGGQIGDGHFCLGPAACQWEAQVAGSAPFLLWVLLCIDLLVLCCFGPTEQEDACCAASKGDPFQRVGPAPPLLWLLGICSTCLPPPVWALACHGLLIWKEKIIHLTSSEPVGRGRSGPKPGHLGNLPDGVEG